MENLPLRRARRNEIEASMERPLMHCHLIIFYFVIIDFDQACIISLSLVRTSYFLEGAHFSLMAREGEIFFNKALHFIIIYILALLYPFLCRKLNETSL